jgi:hypothetical protein
VLVDTDGGNLLYLPLDQLVRQRPAAPTDSVTLPPPPVPSASSSRSREREQR